MSSDGIIGVLLAWWLARLGELLPQGWFGRDAALRRGVVADCDRFGHATFRLRQRGRERALGDDAAALPRRLRRWPVVLRLAMPVLQREVLLPQAAVAEAEAVLRHEMDRLTPFAADAVLWRWRVGRRDPARKQVGLELSLLPKALLAPALAALRAAGLEPEVVEAPGEQGVCCLPLRPPRRHRAPAAAVIGAAVLFCAAATPFVLQSRAQARLDAGIAALRPQVERIEALRRRLASSSVPDAAAAAERRRTGEAMQVLAELTTRLPDDTWLTELSLRQRHVSLSGQSEAAARLIGELSRSAMFRGIGFAGPVTRDGTTGRDDFSLHLDVTP
jgi:general secretion pathway protein L